MKHYPYHTRIVLVLLALITAGMVVPVSGNDEYLDGGFLGVPADIYNGMNPSVTNNIIGTVHDDTLPGLSDDKNLRFGHRLDRDFDKPFRSKYRVFHEPRFWPPYSHFFFLIYEIL